MTVTIRALQPGLEVGVTDTVLYVAPANTQTVVTVATFANVDAGARSLELRCQRAEGPVDVILMSAQIIAPSTTYLSPVLAGIALGAGDKLIGVADQVVSIYAVLSGYEIN